MEAENTSEEEKIKITYVPIDDQENTAVSVNTDKQNIIVLGERPMEISQ